MIFAADETSISEKPVTVRTWARVGRTPTLAHNFNWKRLSAMVFISSCGLIMRDVIPGSFTSGRVLLNLRVLFETIKGQIVVLLDGARIHHSAEIKEWLAQPEVAERFTIERLPPYAPDLNPVELVNSAGKRSGLGNLAANGLDELTKAFHKAFQPKSESITAYFRHALGTDFSGRQASG
jgi:hypothetical protein